MKQLLSILLATTFSIVASAQAWQEFEINEFHFIFDIPPDFEMTDSYHQDGSEGIVFRNPDKHTIIVWGFYLDQRGFLAQVTEQMRRYEELGWRFTYSRMHPSWAVYSGVKVDLIQYVKFITLCDNRVASFLMEYSREQKTEYDPIVFRMEKSMRSNC